MSIVNWPFLFFKTLTFELIIFDNKFAKKFTSNSENESVESFILYLQGEHVFLTEPSSQNQIARVKGVRRISFGITFIP